MSSSIKGSLMACYHPQCVYVCVAISAGVTPFYGTPCAYITEIGLRGQGAGY